MKRILVFGLLLLTLSISLWAFDSKYIDSTEIKSELIENKNTTKKKTAVKKGWSLGPLPVVAFDADKGFQYGALLNLFDFGDGSDYPNPRQKYYIEASAYTKGSQLYKIEYDALKLIPGVRFSAAFNLFVDTAMPFYGFNGYMSYYDWTRIDAGKNGTDYIYSPYYANTRTNPVLKADFIGNIWNKRLFWQAGYHFAYIGMNNLDREAVNRGKEESEKFPNEVPTLFEQYQKWGIIPEDEVSGGISSAIRLGLMYDSRDKEASPSRGIWAEGHLILAPGFLGTSHPHYKYNLTFRHYVPVLRNELLTLAYRVVYQGTIGNSAPYYMLPFMTIMGHTTDKDGFGGYRTTRGILRNRVQGLDVAIFNLELRSRFTSFVLMNQNVSLGLNAFTDGAMTTKPYSMEYQGDPNDQVAIQEYNEYMRLGAENLSEDGHDLPHISVGLGFRVIINENFIIAFEYGIPLNKQDGTNSFYINTGFLF